MDKLRAGQRAAAIPRHFSLCWTAQFGAPKNFQKNFRKIPKFGELRTFFRKVVTMRVSTTRLDEASKLWNVAHGERITRHS